MGWQSAGSDTEMQQQRLHRVREGAAVEGTRAQRGRESQCKASLLSVFLHVEAESMTGLLRYGGRR